MPSKISLAGLILVLLVLNLTIVSKERSINLGTTVILELVPVDPRSLMQGDYMRLNYALGAMIESELKDGDSVGTGTIYLTLDARGVATDVSLESKPGLVPLKYRYQQGRYVFGVESYFFQEGQGHFFSDAKYGEMKVDPQGYPILTHLLDKNLRPIVP